MLSIYEIGDILENPKVKYNYAIDIFENFSLSDSSIPHQHNFYEILWIKSGNGLQAIDFQEYEISPNQIYFIAPGEIHHWSILNQVSGVALMFTEDFYSTYTKNRALLFRNGFFFNAKNRMIVLKEADSIFLDSLFLYLAEEQKDKDADSELTVHLGIDLYLSFLNKKYNFDKKDLAIEENIRILQIKAFIYESLPKFPTPRILADNLGMPVSHLQKIFKKTMSLKQLIISTQLMEAKRRLRYTTESIHEISNSIGFEDPSYFTRLFKKRIGVSPSDFREDIKKS